MKNLPLKSTLSLFILAFLAVFGLQNCGQKEEDKKAEIVSEQVMQEESTTIINADTQTTNNNDPLIINKKDSAKQGSKTVVKKDQEPVKKPDTIAVKPVSPDVKPVTEPVKLPDVKTPVPVKPIPEKVDEPKPVPTPVVTQPTDPNKWIVPAKFINMTNPYPANKESLDLGKSLYTTHCRSCHGSKGDGNGTKAASLDTKVGSFLTSVFQAQTVGEIYYKSIIGRGDMPKFEKKIPDEEERWAIVNYLKSLK